MLKTRPKLNIQQFADEIGVLSKGTTLSYKPNPEGTMKVVAGVKGIPQIGSAPERVDVTDLSSERRQYIEGIPDVENMEFAVTYRTSEFGAFYTFAETAGSGTEFEIAYPGGMKVTLKGKPSVRISAVEVNAALEYVITIVVSEGPEIVPAV